MAKRIPPWHWLRALRRHGPGNPSVHLVLHVLGTFMDRDGDAWPSQAVLAQASRLSTRSVVRAINAARRGGWIAVTQDAKSGQGWRLSHYTACVPDWVDLGELDFEKIADTWQAQLGEANDPLHSRAPRKGGDTQAPRSRTVPAQCSSGDVTERGDKHDINVVTHSPERGDKHDSNVVTHGHTKSSSEVFKKSSEEGHAASGATTVSHDDIEIEMGIKTIPRASPPQAPRTKEAGLKLIDALLDSDTDPERALETAIRSNYAVTREDLAEHLRQRGAAA